MRGESSEGRLRGREGLGRRRERESGEWRERGRERGERERDRKRETLGGSSIKKKVLYLMRESEWERERKF